MGTSYTYGSNDTALSDLVTHTLPYTGELADGVIRQNLVLAKLKSMGRFITHDGGLEFRKPLIIAENTNFKWQAHTADMTATLQTPTDQLRFDIKTFTGAAVINEKHKAMNKGPAMIRDAARDIVQQAKSSIDNSLNSGFWKSSPASTELTSIPTIISATPTTGTLGGLSRSGNTYMQNGVETTTVSDIGAEDGVKALITNVILNAVTANDKPDLLVMAHSRFASLSAYLNALRQYMPSDSLAKIGFSGIQILPGVDVAFEIYKSGWDTITEKYVYGINSKYLSFDLLTDGNFVWDTEWVRVGTTMNMAKYFRIFGELTTGLPKAHFVMTDVS